MNRRNTCTGVGPTVGLLFFTMYCVKQLVKKIVAGVQLTKEHYLENFSEKL